MKVNIYLETDKQNQECTWRKYGYVLEAMAGRCIPVTRVGFGSAEGTYHKCNLQALEEALVRFHKECEVCVYTKPNGCAEPTKKEDDGIDTNIEALEEYICDNIYRYRGEDLNQGTDVAAEKEKNNNKKRGKL